ncbi:inositol monophosphatase family protein [Rhizobium binxianense]|uniref:inositol monophosphatase family protein n=1 Tax=Rhizobium binxianense TaxID=3024242 RepID=UPI003D2EDF28
MDHSFNIVSRSVIKARSSTDVPVCVLSKSRTSQFTQDFLADLGHHGVARAGSSVEFCKLAEGAADYYPCFFPLMQWDTAAGDAVLRVAGGSVATLQGSTLTYGPGEKQNGDFASARFVARGRR